MSTAIINNTTYASTSETKTFEFDFSKGSQGWSADFAEYPEGSEDFFEIAYEFAPLPAHLKTNPKDTADQFAILIKGHNRSDDLFSFMRKKISGLKPMARYLAYFQVTIASNAEIGAVGVGGAPGEDVSFKVGASTEKPKAFANGNRPLNIDKGNQKTNGKNGQVADNIAVEPTQPRGQYRLKTIKNKIPLTFSTDANGQAWFFMGTDSGFEGKTELYYVSAKISIEQEQNWKNPIAPISFIPPNLPTPPILGAPIVPNPILSPFFK